MRSGSRRKLWYTTITEYLNLEKKLFLEKNLLEFLNRQLYQFYIARNEIELRNFLNLFAAPTLKLAICRASKAIAIAIQFYGAIDRVPKSTEQSEIQPETLVAAFINRLVKVRAWVCVAVMI